MKYWWGWKALPYAGCCWHPLKDPLAFGKRANTLISTYRYKQLYAIVKPLLCGVFRLIAPTQSWMILNNVSADRKQGQSGHVLVVQSLVSIAARAAKYLYHCDDVGLGPKSCYLTMVERTSFMKSNHNMHNMHQRAAPWLLFQGYACSIDG